MNSLTEENYIKAIYKLNSNKKHAVTTNSIAELMQTKPASVSDMLKRLAIKKFINYEKYKGVKLTPKGNKLALEIIRKHRLWEVFLVNKLNFKWHEVHDIAEQLEHIRSEELVNRMDAFLDYPKFDPHGDPIPDKNGKLDENNFISLSTVKEGEMVVMTGISEHSTAFLNYLEKNDILLGNEIKVQSVNEYDASMLVTIKNKRNMHISNESAKHILVLRKV